MERLKNDDERSGELLEASEGETMLWWELAVGEVGSLKENSSTGKNKKLEGGKGNGENLFNLINHSGVRVLR